MTKTEEMVMDFRCSKEILLPKADNESIERLHSYRCLGIEIDDQLKFNELLLQRQKTATVKGLHANTLQFQS